MSARPTRARAVVTLSVAVLTLLASARWPSRSHLLPTPQVIDGVKVEDRGTFSAVVALLREGHPYYDAMGQQLRARNYPTSSVLNWRAPLYLELLARLPPAVPRITLAVMNFALLVATLYVCRARPLVGWVAGALQVGVVLLFSASDAVVFGEVWAGVLLGLATVLLMSGQAGAGVGAALSALFLRELAGVYCAAAGALAIRQRKWTELMGWMLGAVAYAAYFAWHVSMVTAHQVPADFTREHSNWLSLGGLPFLLSTVEKLGWLAFVPASIAALALAFVASSVASPATPTIVRVASGVFAAFFLAIGQPFNDYWGWIVAPSWALAAGYGVAAVWDATVVLTRRRRAA